MEPGLDWARVVREEGAENAAAVPVCRVLLCSGAGETCGGRERKSTEEEWLRDHKHNVWDPLDE